MGATVTMGFDANKVEGRELRAKDDITTHDVNLKKGDIVYYNTTNYWDKTIFKDQNGDLFKLWFHPSYIYEYFDVL